jgi:DNA polymerase III alpha subunit
MDMPISKIQLASVAPATKQTRLDWEKEFLGLYVSDHPTSEYQSYFNQAATPLGSLEKQSDGARVRLGGVITTVRKVLTKTGSTMYFVGLEDITGRIEMLVFGKAAERTGDAWMEGAIVIVDARVSLRDGDLKCIAEAVEKISQHTLEQFARATATRTKLARPAAEATAPPAAEKRLVITVDTTNPTGTIAALSQCLKTIPDGERGVSVHIGHTLIETTFTIDSTPKHIAVLLAITGVSAVAEREATYKP